MDSVECRVCGQEVGRGPAGLGIKQHSKRHRREFRDLTGRKPNSYAEVVEFFETEGRQPTLLEAVESENQAAIVDF
jgi:hypothetical protein